MIPRPDEVRTLACRFLQESTPSAEVQGERHTRTKRDNQMAVFTIGLSDMCLINLEKCNIEGMEQILTMVMRSFLKFRYQKDWKYEGQCMVLHQKMDENELTFKHQQDVLLDTLNTAAKVWV